MTVKIITTTACCPNITIVQGVFFNLMVMQWQWKYIITAVCVGTIMVLIWSLASWLQMPDIWLNPDEKPDAVYLVAGADEQDRRIGALMGSIDDGVLILIGNDDSEGAWLSEVQRNLTMAEWAVYKIKNQFAIAGWKGMEDNLRVEIVPGNFKGTDEEMESLAAYLKGKPTVRKLAIVTSPFHIRRVILRLKTYLEVDIVVSAVRVDSHLIDRAPWIVLIEFVKITRDMMGLSRTPLISRTGIME